MSGNVKTQIGKIIGKTLNSYYPRVKPTIDNLKFKQEYQNRIIECMVGEVDDNYITTPETDNPIVKLEHSKEGLVKVPTVKGKTILVDADGNETDTPAEGCKLLSVGEQEDSKLIILSKNKNLFDGTWEIGNVSSVDGTNVGNDKYHRTSYIKIKPNTNYSINHGTGVYFYDEDYSYISFVISSSFLTPANCRYVRFRLGATLDRNTFHLEEGLSITSYIPHKYHKTEILLDKPLRRLNDEIYDEIVDNKIIRRVGRVVFSGEEAWWYPTNFGLESGEDYIAFCGDKLYTKSPINAGYRCNVLNYKRYDGGFRTTLNFEGISDGGGYRMTFIRIKKEKLKTNDIQGFKDYLSDNPMEVLYALNEPIIEELPNSITTQGFDDTTMYIENSITATVSYGYNALIPYKNELSSQKEEVEVNTLDIENNIIPYLMDMEFNLIMMEDEE